MYQIRGKWSSCSIYLQISKDTHQTFCWDEMNLTSTHSPTYTWWIKDRDRALARIKGCVNLQSYHFLLNKLPKRGKHLRGNGVASEQILLALPLSPLFPSHFLHAQHPSFPTTTCNPNACKKWKEPQNTLPSEKHSVGHPSLGYKA